jgi:hypothetical protein
MPHAEDFEGKLPADHIISSENASHNKAPACLRRVTFGK